MPYGPTHKLRSFSTLLDTLRRLAMTPTGLSRTATPITWRARWWHAHFHAQVTRTWLPHVTLTYATRSRFMDFRVSTFQNFIHNRRVPRSGRPFLEVTLLIDKNWKHLLVVPICVFLWVSKTVGVWDPFWCLGILGSVVLVMLPVSSRTAQLWYIT
jgi:hypothetical protein